jgi:thiosulfate/3-mercaptopyruvate sulfurtransferase
MSPIIHIHELAEIYTNPEVIILEVTNGKDARDNYEKCHLKGAFFIDLNSELSSPSEDPKNGGRHPLPDIKNFLSVLAQYGISNTSHVICYDRHFGANAAARLWWMLRSMGHEKVQVLNGGFQVPEQYNYMLSDSVEMPAAKSSYTLPIHVSWGDSTVQIDEVERNIKEKAFTLIDVREQDRFLGIVEPLDLIAGHIPEALNIPFKLNLNSQGYFKSPEEIQANYKGIQGKVVVHCGSGVTACHSILAMDYVGLPVPSLYVGSWSEWSRSSLPKITSLG